MDAEFTEPGEHEAQALAQSLAGIRTPAEAAAALDSLEKTAGNRSEEEMAGSPADKSVPFPKSTSGSPAGAAATTIRDLAQEAASAGSAPDVDHAVSEITGGPDREIADPRVRTARRLLRRELIRRLQPLDAVDAMVFVEINHLPHPRWADRFFTQFSWAMTGGAGWSLVLLGQLLWKRKAGWRTVLGVAPALFLATLTVEYPIKSYVRRKRPFLALLEAIVVGRQPGSFSFPSGHTAAAFAGAVLLSRHLPRGRGFFYFIAGMVAFSRVYLGAHYPGDVVVGSAVGTFLARVYARFLGKLGLPALPSGKR